jgi:hypothetical protein
MFLFWVFFILVLLIPIVLIGLVSWLLWKKGRYGRLGSIGLIALLIGGFGYAFWPRAAKEFAFADFPRAKADAVALMATAKEKGGEESWYTINGEELPESLRSEVTGWAYVHPDHISLVQFSCPDYMYGIRIWKDGATVPADEKPTQYPNVTHYFVDKDVPAVAPKK